MTQTRAIDPRRPQPGLILEAARVIQTGGLVAFPTETVYGLGANGLDPAAVRRIFAAKGRPSTDPLILHLPHAADLELVAVLSGREELVARLSARFMPGPLTLVLPRRAQVPLEVTAGGETVAVRVPAHPVAHALIEAAKLPIAAPSANLFSRPSPTTAAAVLEDLDERIDLVLDGGETPIGLESTVLSLVGPPTLLRPGGVALEALELLIGEVLLPGEAMLEAASVQPAPGMLVKHYSPRAKLLLLEYDTSLEQRLESVALEALSAGERLGLLLPSSSLRALAGIQAERVDLGESAAQAASRLFSGMRALDGAGCSVILAQQWEPSGLGRALNDRLYRAASGRLLRGP